MTSSSKNHWSGRRKGFTLVELILAIGFFGLISALLMGSLLSVYRVKAAISAQKSLNFEASAVLNSALAGLIRSGFAIDYGQSQSQILTGESEGLQAQSDRLSVFTDRAETQSFTVYREPHQDDGEVPDSAGLVLEFSGGKKIPLHSSDIVVEAFDIELPPAPWEPGADPDLQPYVWVYLRARPRKAEGQSLDQAQQDLASFAPTAYRTLFSLRNTRPSQQKHPL